MQVKELKEILKNFKDTDDVTLYDVANGERIYINAKDIEYDIDGCFEVNINSETDYKNSLISKTLSCEIDAELFFDKISMDTKAWNFDYDSLEEYPEVEEYLKAEYPQEYEMLKEGKADYIEVWYD